MAVGDVYQITDIQSYVGQQTLNVYYYRMISAGTGGGVGASALAGQFDNFVTAQVVKIQDTDCTHELLRVINIPNPDDFDERVPTNSVGLIAGFSSPPFVALRFRSKRNAPGQRYSYKRLGGVSESVVSGNTIDPAFTDEAELIADSFALVLTGALGEQFEPVQVKRPVVYGTNPVVNRALSGPEYWEFTQVTSQSSRVLGHGG